MTLADLAAMATKVEGFKRPMGPCEECEAKGTVYRDEFYHLNGGFVPCPSCNGTKVFPSDSPAALAMAVWVMPGHSIEKHARDVYVYVELVSGCRSAKHDGTPEVIARALLTALLRAHGVEVPSD